MYRLKGIKWLNNDKHRYLRWSCFLFFFFCKFFRDLSTFTDTMAAEGICERNNNYWIYVIPYWLYAGPITPKRLHIYNQLSIKQVKLR